MWPEKRHGQPLGHEDFLSGSLKIVLGESSQLIEVAIRREIVITADGAIPHPEHLSAGFLETHEVMAGQEFVGAFEFFLRGWFIAEFTEFFA